MIDAANASSPVANWYPVSARLGQHQEVGVGRGGVLDRTVAPAGVDRDVTLEDLELADREHCRRHAAAPLTRGIRREPCG